MDFLKVLIELLIIFLWLPSTRSHYRVLDGILNNDYQKVFPIQLTYGEDIKKSEYSSKNKKINTLTNENLKDHINSVSFNLGNLKDHGEVILDVKINKQLISPGFSQSVFTKETGEIEIPKTIKTKNHCNYIGVVRNKVNSFVAVSTCKGIRGYIELDDLYYIIEPINNSLLTEGHVVYHPSNHVMFEPEMRERMNKTCHLKDVTKTNNLDSFSTNTRVKRDSEGENTYFIEMLMVMDEYVYKRFSTTKEREDHILEIINIVDSYYKKLNMRVVLSHIEYWKENRIELDTSPVNDLNAFVKYRYNRLREPFQTAWHRTDVAHLLVGRDIQGTTIGFAQVSAMCSPRGGSINQDLSSPLTVANTLAHEMGHNLGMLHDEGDCNCDANSDCIMAPRAGFRMKKSWSQCSLEYLREGLRMGLGNCLMNIPEARTLVGGPQCGNEIVEMGEECDCGNVDDCTSLCCNPATCKLRSGAKCDNGPCCSKCNFVESGVECRSSDNECQLPEYCTGTSASCPANLYKEDGTPCQDNQLCSGGVCMTHDLQCQIIWGESARKGDDRCYTSVNRLGNENGNCGRNEDDSFKPCKSENALCGKLNCHSGENFPVLGGLINRFTYTNTVYKVDEKCKTVQSVMKKAGESDIKDVACVQPGTACGKNMVCDEGECKVMESLTCSDKCNGKGICNNLKQCHCEKGWEGQFCDKISSSGTNSIYSTGQTLIREINVTFFEHSKTTKLVPTERSSSSELSSTVSLKTTKRNLPNAEKSSSELSSTMSLETTKRSSANTEKSFSELSSTTSLETTENSPFDNKVTSKVTSSSATFGTTHLFYSKKLNTMLSIFYLVYFPGAI